MACQLVELITVFTCKFGLLLSLSQAAIPTRLPHRHIEAFSSALKKLIGLSVVETLLIPGTKTLHLIRQLIGTKSLQAGERPDRPLGCPWGELSEPSVLELV